MPIETATYISDLVPANPLTTDPVNQGDDHLRLIKQVLQTTLPGTGSLAGALVPIAGIIMWSGLVASIPANWALCDGGTYNGHLTPDLRNRFIMGGGDGTGGTLNPGSLGGSTTTSSDGSHSHTGSTGGHAVLVTELPTVGGAGPTQAVSTKNGDGSTGAAHTHPISADGAHTHTVTPPYCALAFIMRVA